MRILHLNAGNETGGGMYHILHLLKQLTADRTADVMLGVFEKKELYHLAEQENIQTIYFPNKTRISFPLLKRISDFIQQENISIVHTHGPRANVYVNAIRKRVPFHWITTVHSHPEFDFREKGFYGKLLYQLHINAIKNAHKVITVCDAFNPSLIDSFVEERKITTILNGINFTEENGTTYERDYFGYCNEDFLFLKVARLEEVKGHRIALKAFAKLTQKINNCHLLFVGDGTLRNQLMDLANELQIGNNVTFFGEQKEVEAFYNLADITLLSSFSEGFPLVLLESARAKTPIISTNVGGVNQLIVNDHVGWKVEPNRVDELAQAMEEAYYFREDGQLQLIGENLYTHASEKFSLENFANNVYNVYLDNDCVN